MVRVLHCAELALKKDCLVLFDRLLKILRDISDIRRDHIAVCQKRLQKFLLIDRIRVIEMLKKDVLFDTYIRDLLRENGFLLKQFVDLETDLRVFVGIERRDAGLCGAE